MVHIHGFAWSCHSLSTVINTWKKFCYKTSYQVSASFDHLQDPKCWGLVCQIIVNDGFRWNQLHDMETFNFHHLIHIHQVSKCSSVFSVFSDHCLMMISQSQCTMTTLTYRSTHLCIDGVTSIFVNIKRSELTALQAQQLSDTFAWRLTILQTFDHQGQPYLTKYKDMFVSPVSFLP